MSRSAYAFSASAKRPFRKSWSGSSPARARSAPTRLATISSGTSRTVGRNALRSARKPSISRKRQRGQQEEEETLLLDPDLAALERLRRRPGPDAVEIEHVEIQIAGHRPDVRAAGVAGDLLQALLVHAREHHVPLLVLLEAALAAARDRPAGGLADAEHEDLDPFFGGLARGLEPPPLVVFAVGDQEHDLVRFRLRVEGRQAGFDGRPEIRPGGGDEFRAQRLEKHVEGGVVERQRTLHVGGPGERDQADPVALDDLEEIVDFPPGPLQPVGFDVLHQHARGDVREHDDVDAFLRDLLVVAAPARPGEREDHQAERGEEQRDLHGPHPRDDRAGQAAEEFGFGEAGQGFSPLPVIRQQRQADQREQPEEMEDPGTFRMSWQHPEDGQGQERFPAPAARAPGSGSTGTARGSGRTP